MNQDQIVNLLTKIIISACAALASKYGIGKADLSHWATLGATTIVGLAAFAYSHNWNAKPDAPAAAPDSPTKPTAGSISLKFMVVLCLVSTLFVSLIVMTGCASFNRDVFDAEQLATSSAQTATHTFNLYYEAQVSANNTNAIAKLNVVRDELYDADRKLSVALMELERARQAYATNSTTTNKTTVTLAMQSVSTQSSNIVQLARQISK